MEKKELKKINELLEGAECYLVVSNKGMSVEATDSQLMTLLNLAVTKVIEEVGMPKESIKKTLDMALEVAGMNKKEKTIYLLNKLKEEIESK